MKNMIMHPATPAVLGVANLILANGNIYMYVTGVLLLITSLMEYMEK